jgi:hypothetical protein
MQLFTYADAIRQEMIAVFMIDKGLTPLFCVLVEPKILGRCGEVPTVGLFEGYKFFCL